jgi:hypothetical protein
MSGKPHVTQRDGQQHSPRFRIVHPVCELPGIVGQIQPVGGGMHGLGIRRRVLKKESFCVFDEDLSNAHRLHARVQNIARLV